MKLASGKPQKHGRASYTFYDKGKKKACRQATGRQPDRQTDRQTDAKNIKVCVCKQALY
jgi:hypothetical protein